jgi:hypothetical protein
MIADVAALFLTGLVSPPYIMIRRHFHAETGVVFLGSLRRAGNLSLPAEDKPAILELTTTLLERQVYTMLAASTPGKAIRLARVKSHGHEE